jgi:hypothetical protein
MRKCTCKHLEAAHCKYYGCTQCRCKCFRAQRDPRVDPNVGDVVLAHGRERTIHCLYEGDRYGWATESPLASGIVGIAAWRRWAKDGELIRIEGRS